MPFWKVLPVSARIECAAFQVKPLLAICAEHGNAAADFLAANGAKVLEGAWVGFDSGYEKK